MHIYMHIYAYKCSSHLLVDSHSSTLRAQVQGLERDCDSVINK